MNESNHSSPNGVNNYNNNSTPLLKHPKLFLRDNIQESQSSYAQTSSNELSTPHLIMPPFHSAHQHSPVPILTDNVLCDGMNECHLADSSVTYMNPHVKLPITHIANQIPILNSYIPHELQSYQNNLYQQQNYLLHRNYLNRYYLNERYKYVNMTDNNSVMQTYPQQRLFCDGFSRHAELYYEEATHSHHQQKCMSEAKNNIHDNNQLPQKCHFNETPELTEQNIEDGTQTLYQDKTNFRDENREINGCFFDIEKRFPSKNREKPVAAPKKKWIENYLTSSAGI